MYTLNEMRNDQHLVNQIDWDMTPEKAVALYLEWGTGLDEKARMHRSPNEVSHYFVVYFWDDEPVVQLVRRDIRGADDLAEISLPPELQKRFVEHWGGHKGLYALTDDIKAWLREELGLDATWH